jgi:hypothetical protein
MIEKLTTEKISLHAGNRKLTLRLHDPAGLPSGSCTRQAVAVSNLSDGFSFSLRAAAGVLIQVKQFLRQLSARFPHVVGYLAFCDLIDLVRRPCRRVRLRDDHALNVICAPCIRRSMGSVCAALRLISPPNCALSRCTVVPINFTEATCPPLPASPSPAGPSRNRR